MEQKNETSMRISVSRSKQGIVLGIKGNIILEDFMRNLGNGTQQLVEDVGGDLWTPLTNAPLRIWHGHTATLNEIAGTMRITLSQPGMKLEFPPDGYNNAVYNLTFLRLVGISEGEGVRFIIKNAVLGNDGVIDLRDKLVSLTKMLYINYIRPIEAVGEIYKTSTQEFVD